MLVFSWSRGIAVLSDCASFKIFQFILLPSPIAVLWSTAGHSSKWPELFMLQVKYLYIKLRLNDFHSLLVSYNQTHLFCF